MEAASCGSCGITRRVMKRCTRCRNAFYCSRECQIKSWAVHREKCHVVNVGPDEKPIHREVLVTAPISERKVAVKCNHKKHELILLNVENCTGNEIITQFSKKLRIPVNALKLIAKGKLVDSDTISDMVLKRKCSVFQAFGEETEDDEGLHGGDIQAIIDDLHVSRNEAIRSLRSCNGDLIDAILELGNKL